MILPAAAQPPHFDTSGLPRSPTTFEEQRLRDDIETARKYPELAPAAHNKLADYYETRGLADLAARERGAAQGVDAPGQDTVQQPTVPGSGAPAQPPASTADGAGAAPADHAQVSANDDQLDPKVFDLSALASRARGATLYRRTIWRALIYQ